MARWEPGSAGRLRDAALELYEQQGYERTTVADIAERAGVTSRTFFRHYADKREVLFGGSELLVDGVRHAVAAAPADASPMDVVAAALASIAAVLGRDRDWARRRNAVIAATPELLERELAKLATFSAEIAGGLSARGVDPVEAQLAGDSAMAVLRVAFERWTSANDATALDEVMEQALARLRALTGA